MNNDIYKADVKTDKGNTVIAVRAWYDKGGANYFTGAIEARGYYLSASPVEIDGAFRCYKAFSGVKKCLITCARKSPKTEAAALAMIEAEAPALIKAVAEKNGLTLTAPIEAPAAAKNDAEYRAECGSGKHDDGKAPAAIDKVFDTPRQD